MKSCHGVFTNHTIFRTTLSRLLNTFSYKSHKPDRETYRPENELLHKAMKQGELIPSKP